MDPIPVKQSKIIIPSVSLGRVSAGHKLLTKIKAASDHGYSGIECTFECLEDLANDIAPDQDRTSRLVLAAQKARSMADQLNTGIYVLQAFGSFEGLLDRSLHAAKIEEGKLWVQLARILGAEVIQVPSNVTPKSDSTGNFNAIAADLQELANLGVAEEGEVGTIRFAYENLEWGTHVTTWQQAYEIMQLVDRPNFGLCIDTFHIAGLLYGDPTEPGGLRPGGAAKLKQSMQEMYNTLPQEAIFLFQLSDAHILDPPLPKQGSLPDASSLNKFYNKKQAPGLTWSRNARPFPLTDGYLPVLDVAEIVYGLGYRGLSSMEVFTPLHHQKDPQVPDTAARIGMASWKALLQQTSIACLP